MGERLEIKYIPIGDLHPYENNPRLNDDAVPFVESSISKFGMKVPIVVDANNVIVCGHTRVRACENLGIKEVPCIVADDLDEDQINAFRLADNKVSELAGWDFAKLDMELDNLDGVFDMEDFGFIMEDFDNALADIGTYESFDVQDPALDIQNPETEYSDSPEVVAHKVPEPEIDINAADLVIRRGDVITLGRHTLFCGNIFDVSGIYSAFGYSKADIGIAIKLSSDPDNMSEIADMMTSFSEEVFCGHNPVKGSVVSIATMIADKKNSYKDMIYWRDTVPVSTGDTTSIVPTMTPIAVFDPDKPNNGFRKEIGIWNGIIEARSTGYMLPLTVPTELIERTADNDGVVFGCMDPYGSILIACEDTGRSARQVEPSCEACQYIVKRYIERTGTDSDVLLYRNGEICTVDWY